MFSCEFEDVLDHVFTFVGELQIEFDTCSKYLQFYIIRLFKERLYKVGLEDFVAVDYLVCVLSNNPRN